MVEFYGVDGWEVDGVGDGHIACEHDGEGVGSGRVLLRSRRTLLAEGNPAAIPFFLLLYHDPSISFVVADHCLFG